MPTEKISIDNALTRRQIMKKYNLPHTTAFTVKKRGYLAIRTKKMNASLDKFNYNVAIKASRYIFFNKIRIMFSRPNPLELFDDLQQEAILRCIELSGCLDGNPGQNDFAFYCKVSERAMWTYLKKEKILGPYAGRISSYYDDFPGKEIYE